MPVNLDATPPPHYEALLRQSCPFGVGHARCPIFDRYPVVQSQGWAVHWEVVTAGRGRYWMYSGSVGRAATERAYLGRRQVFGEWEW